MTKFVDANDMLPPDDRATLKAYLEKLAGQARPVLTCEGCDDDNMQHFVSLVMVDLVGASSARAPDGMLDGELFLSSIVQALIYLSGSFQEPPEQLVGRLFVKLAETYTDDTLARAERFAELLIENRAGTG